MMSRSNMTKIGLFKLAALPLMMGLSSSAIAEQDNKVKPELTPCYAKGLDDRLLCGSIKQPVSDNPADGEIDIHFAIIPAIKPSKPDEAVLGFAGGPGQSATELAVIFDRNLRYARESRDILLVDQRGTGKSNKLQCDGADLISQFELNDLTGDMDAFAKEDTEKCKEKLNTDLTHYSTVAAAKDFEAVKEALGYKGLHLYGVSYGTRIAQEYTRQFPSSVLTSTLDGVVPMQQSLTAIGKAIDDSMNALLDRCEADANCSKNYPNLKANFYKLLEQLDEQAIETTVRHPRTHKKINLVLTKMKVFSTVRMALYSHTTRALVPLAISEALNGDYSPIVGLLSSTDMMDSMAMGMHSAIVCSEDWPSLTDSSRADHGQAYMGRMMIEGFDIACPIWDAKPVDKSFYEPVKTNIPTLLLSGGLDPATPASWAEMAMVEMSNAKHLVAESATHGVVSQTCAASIVGKFIDSNGTEELDATCLEKDNRKQFFMNLNGVALQADSDSESSEKE